MFWIKKELIFNIPQLWNMKLLTVVSTKSVILIECEATKFQTCSKSRLLITLNLGIVYLLWNINPAETQSKMSKWELFTPSKPEA